MSTEQTDQNAAKPILIREFSFSSDHYKKALRLRAEVLRDPLGLKFSPDDLAPDARDIHVGAFQGGELIGCLILTQIAPPMSIATKATALPSAMKMRQVAVHPSKQGQGVGKMLALYCEEITTRIGAQEIVLSARETAVPFYLGLGYEIIGEPLIEVTLPHRKMRKLLAKSSSSLA
jgi:ribosomal protein S18 acetylase RimI-like enzyme